MSPRAPRRSTVALAAAATLASTGSAYVGARTFLSGQADQARRVIPKAWDIPPRADGVYSPGGGPVERWHRGVQFDLHLMVFGDSTATGYGARNAEEVLRLLMRNEGKNAMPSAHEFMYPGPSGFTYDFGNSLPMRKVRRATA